MSGSFYDVYHQYGLVSPDWTISGSFYPAKEYHEYVPPSVDDLWERMYINPKPVIIVCSFCHSHNVISNPTCIQCGAPLGMSKQRVY